MIRATRVSVVAYSVCMMAFSSLSAFLIAQRIIVLTAVLAPNQRADFQLRYHFPMSQCSVAIRHLFNTAILLRLAQHPHFRHRPFLV